MYTKSTARGTVVAFIALLSVTGCSKFFVGERPVHHKSFSVSPEMFDGHTYPAVVLGGGVAGLTASIYLALANVQTLLVQGSVPGGLLTQSLSVRNWPGESEAPGMAITDKMRAQAVSHGVEMVPEQLQSIDTATWPYVLTLSQLGDAQKTRTVRALTVIVAMGAQSNYLGIPGEQEHWGKGVTNCAVCEGALYKDKVVCVVGGGNSAIEEAHYLAGIAKKVLVFVRKNTLRATDKRKEDLARMSNVEFIYNNVLTEIVGDDAKVTGVKALNVSTKDEKTYAVDGVFLAIGFTPNTSLFHTVLSLDARGYIALLKDQETSVPGIFAAGDIVDPVYKQAVTAAGDACRSALQAHAFLCAAGFQSAMVAQGTKPNYEAQKSLTPAPAPVIQQSVKKASVMDMYEPGVVHDIRSPKEFAALINNATLPIVIDFYATFCGPCRAMAPLYKKLAERFKGKALLVKVNIQDLGGMATTYRIQGVPTFVFLKEGQECDRAVGSGISESQFAQRIEALL